MGSDENLKPYYFFFFKSEKNIFLSGLVASECTGASTVIVLTGYSTDIVLNGLSTLLLLVLAWLLCQQALDWLLCLLVIWLAGLSTVREANKNRWISIKP